MRRNGNLLIALQGAPVFFGICFTVLRGIFPESASPETHALASAIFGLVMALMLEYF